MGGDGLKILFIVIISISTTLYSIKNCYADYFLELEHIRQIDPSDGIGEWIYEYNQETGRNEKVGSRTYICGPVSLLIASGYIDKFSLSNQRIKDLIDWMVTVNIYTDANKYSGYITNGDSLVKIANNYYKYKQSEWHSSNDTSFDQGIKLIEFSLRKNVPVIIGTHLEMDRSKLGHFMVADGLKDVNSNGLYSDDDDQIHVTDPATNLSHKQTYYTIKEFKNTYQGVLLLDTDIGRYSDGFHAGGKSQAFLNAYEEYKDIIGYPRDNNDGGVFVHEYKGAEDDSFSVWIQDYFNPVTKRWYALVLNDLDFPLKAHLLQGGIRHFYMTRDGPFRYGVPFTGEINGSLSDSHLTEGNDFVRPSSYEYSTIEPKRIVVQKFKRRRNGTYYNNQRRTIVHDPDTGDTDHFPVGEFAVRPDLALGSVEPVSGDVVLFADTNNIYNKYPWPVQGENKVPTDYKNNGEYVRWFVKAGQHGETYSIFVNTIDGDPKIQGLIYPIHEGNFQYIGTNEDENGNPEEEDYDVPVLDEPIIYPPVNIIVTDATTNKISLEWNRGINPVVSGGYQYEVELNGEVLQTVSDERHSFLGLSPDTEYTIRIRTRLNGEFSDFSSYIFARTKAEAVSMPGQFQSVTTTISHSYYENSPINEKSSFYNDATYVFGWLMFDNVVGELDLEYRCYDPYNNLMQVDVEHINYANTMSNINIRGECTAFRGTHELGQWRIEYYINNQYIGTDYFSVTVHITHVSSFSAGDVTASSVELTWGACERAWSYLLYRNDIFIAETDKLSYRDSGLAPATDYVYRIVPRAGPVISLFSRELNVKTPNGYEFVNTIVSEDWTYGSNDSNSPSYWDLQAVNPSVDFTEGDSVCVLSKIEDVKVDHRWLTEFFMNGSLVWEDESGWQRVGDGWGFSSAKPIWTNIPTGKGEAKVWLDVGHGFELLSTKTFTVIGRDASFVYVGSTVSEGWTYGSSNPNSPSYWDLQAVSPRVEFSEGGSVCILSKIKDVKVDHRWRTEFFMNGTLIWKDESVWQRVGDGWGFSNSMPLWTNVPNGTGKAKVWLDVGQGYELLSTKFFTVTETATDTGSNTPSNVEKKMNTPAIWLLLRGKLDIHEM